MDSGLVTWDFGYHSKVRFFFLNNGERCYRRSDSRLRKDPARIVLGLESISSFLHDVLLFARSFILDFRFCSVSVLFCKMMFFPSAVSLLFEIDFLFRTDLTQSQAAGRFRGKGR